MPRTISKSLIELEKNGFFFVWKREPMAWELNFSKISTGWELNCLRTELFKKWTVGRLEIELLQNWTCEHKAAGYFQRKSQRTDSNEWNYKPVAKEPNGDFQSNQSSYMNSNENPN